MTFSENKTGSKDVSAKKAVKKVPRKTVTKRAYKSKDAQNQGPSLDSKEIENDSLYNNSLKDSSSAKRGSLKKVLPTLLRFIFRAPGGLFKRVFSKTKFEENSKEGDSKFQSVPQRGSLRRNFFLFIYISLFFSLLFLFYLHNAKSIVDKEQLEEKYKILILSNFMVLIFVLVVLLIIFYWIFNKLSHIHSFEGFPINQRISFGREGYLDEIGVIPSYFKALDGVVKGGKEYYKTLHSLNNPSSLISPSDKLLPLALFGRYSPSDKAPGLQFKMQNGGSSVVLAASWSSLAPSSSYLNYDSAPREPLLSLPSTLNVPSGHATYDVAKAFIDSYIQYMSGLETKLSASNFRHSVEKWANDNLKPKLANLAQNNLNNFKAYSDALLTELSNHPHYIKYMGKTASEITNLKTQVDSLDSDSETSLVTQTSNQVYDVARRILSCYADQRYAEILRDSSRLVDELKHFQAITTEAIQQHNHLKNKDDFSVRSNLNTIKSMYLSQIYGFLIGTQYE